MLPAVLRSFMASNALMFEKINEIELKQLDYQKHTEERFDKIFRYISEKVCYNVLYISIRRGYQSTERSGNHANHSDL